MDLVLTSYFILTGLLDLTALSNLLFAPKLKRKTSVTNGELISIVIPMRNEELNAERILNDLLAQEYQNFEIVVVDDNSTDKTWVILSKYRNNPKVKLIKLEKDPIGWGGKSWAIWKGLSSTKGRVFLFIDADVRVASAGIGSAYGDMMQSKADVLNCFPGQIAKTIGETLTIPLMSWSTAGNLPVALVNRSGSGLIVMANGQFLMCTREAYEKIGGHDSVRSLINEDQAIICRFKKFGFKTRIVLGDELVRCRMYRGYKDALQGFGRSVVSSFGNIPKFLFVISLWIIVFMVPFILVFIDLRYIWIIGMILIHRLLTSLTSRENPLWNMLTHPIQMVNLLMISFYSFYLKLNNKIVWKGRPVDLSGGNNP